MEHIQFRQQRDFGEILGVTFAFIRQNFSKMLKPIFTYSVLPVLVGSIAMSSSYINILTNPPLQGQLPKVPFQNMWISMLIGYPLLVVGMVAFYLIVNAYVKLYANNQEPTSAFIFEELKKKFWSYLGGFIMIGFMVGLGFLLCFIPGIYVGVIFAPVFIVMMVENTGPFTAMSRCSYLIKNEWWNTFGLYIVVYIIQILIVGVFSIPMYIFTFLGILHSTNHETAGSFTDLSTGYTVGIVIFSCIYYLGILFSSIISTVAVDFKYFSLVEQKEGIGDLEKIGNIGETE